MLSFIDEMIGISYIFLQAELDFIVICSLIGCITIYLNSRCIRTTDIVIGCAGIHTIASGHHHLIDTGSGTALGNKLLGVASGCSKAQRSCIFNRCHIYPSSPLS